MIKLRILRWEIILNYLDRPSISTRVLQECMRIRQRRKCDDRGRTESERERKKAREKEIH